jgi:hypothetical protein
MRSPTGRFHKTSGGVLNFNKGERMKVLAKCVLAASVVCCGFSTSLLTGQILQLEEVMLGACTDNGCRARALATCSKTGGGCDVTAGFNVKCGCRSPIGGHKKCWCKAS